MQLRKFLVPFLLLVFGFSACKIKSQHSVADIMKHYKEINEKLPKYTRKNVDDITSAASGNITGYYREDEVKKIIGQHYSDTCRTFTEYYFDDGMLIFILQQNFVYNKPRHYTEEKALAVGDSVWYDDKKTRMEQSRFYFSGNKLTKWIDPTNTEVPANSFAFTRKESQLWAESIVLMKELKEQ